MKSIRVVVSGAVQGVGYRAFIAREATARPVRGYVRNLSDGRVEALFTGLAKAVDELVALSGQGPAEARVDDCALTPLSPGAAQALGAFVIL